jgi:hypothetical protein
MGSDCNRAVTLLAGHFCPRPSAAQRATPQADTRCTATCQPDRHTRSIDIARVCVGCGPRWSRRPLHQKRQPSSRLTARMLTGRRNVRQLPSGLFVRSMATCLLAAQQLGPSRTSSAQAPDAHVKRYNPVSCTLSKVGEVRMKRLASCQTNCGRGMESPRAVSRPPAQSAHDAGRPRRCYCAHAQEWTLPPSSRNDRHQSLRIARQTSACIRARSFRVPQLVEQHAPVL